MKKNSVVARFIWQNMLFMILMWIAAPLAAVGQEIQTFTGEITTFAEEDDGVITEAELEAVTVDGMVYYSILLTDKTKKLVKEFENTEVEVTGTLVMKDDEEWLSINTCQHVLIGTVRASKNNNGEIKSIQLQCDSRRTFEIPLCDRSKVCGTKMDGKKVRAVGLIQFKNNKKIFTLSGYRELIAGKGHLEVDEDSEGKALAIRFAFVDPKSGNIQRYPVKLDDAGRELAGIYANESVELSGTLLIESGKTWLTVLKCDYSMDEEDEELEVEIDDDGDGSDE